MNLKDLSMVNKRFDNYPCEITSRRAALKNEPNTEY